MQNSVQVMRRSHVLRLLLRCKSKRHHLFCPWRQRSPRINSSNNRNPRWRLLKPPWAWVNSSTSLFSNMSHWENRMWFISGLSGAHVTSGAAQENLPEPLMSSSSWNSILRGHTCQDSVYSRLPATEPLSARACWLTGTGWIRAGSSPGSRTGVSW